MIFTFLLYGLATAIGLLISRLPTGNLPAGISDAVQWMVEATYKFDDIIPATTLWQIVGAFVAFETAVLLFRLVQWAYHQFWGSK